MIYRQRLWGTFAQPLNLIDFPFDKQQFKIQLAAIGYNMKEIELRPNPQGRMGIAELSVTDWNILDWQTGAAPYKLIPGNDTALPGFSFSFEAERKSEYFVVKVILPLILIVAMS